MFRYTQLKRGSKKIDWCTTGACLTIHARAKGPRLKNKIRRMHIYACTDEQSFMFRVGVYIDYVLIFLI